MKAPEIELKFPVDEPAAFRKRVEAAGCGLVTERTFESNTLYDTEERSLRAKRNLLRLRQYGELWTVTHKRVPDDFEEGGRYKKRIETETQVADGEAMAEVFERLGYGPVFRYEKYRTEWECGPGHVVLDETPIGVWAEVEGPTEWIDEMVVKLGVRQETCITDSYGMLFLAWKERTGSSAENLTFEEAGAVAA